MNKLILSIMFLFCVVATSCSDHDDPVLSSIDLDEVEISAKVDMYPTSVWLTTSDEMIIRVDDLRMTAPQGVELKSITLCNNEKPIASELYSDEALEFRVPLEDMKGVANFSIVGDLVKKNCRDAQIVIEKDRKRLVFTEIPEFYYKAHLNVTVKSESTTGEEFYQNFDLESEDGLTFLIPQDKLFWTPSSGSASEMELTLSGSVDTWSPNSTLEIEITEMSWPTYAPTDPVLMMSIPNEPGALDKLKLRMDAKARIFGTTEDITIEPLKASFNFYVIES